MIRTLKYYFYLYYNRLRFKFHGIFYGKNTRIYNAIYLRKHKNSSFYIGDSVAITSGDNINPISKNSKCSIYIESGGLLKIGSYTAMSSPCIWVSREVIIEDHVLVGANCLIIDTDAHSLDWRQRGFRGQINGCDLDSSNAHFAPIHIEHDTMIGANVTILKGASIGAFSIIGAGSVVTKNIPSNCIAAGNPCKVIKKL